jgi:hypothetical protein
MSSKYIRSSYFIIRHPTYLVVATLFCMLAPALSVYSYTILTLGYSAHQSYMIALFIKPGAQYIPQNLIHISM